MALRQRVTPAPAPVKKAEPVRNKVSICLRVDPDVLEYFKSSGPGYQTRMMDVLRKHMEENE